MNSYRNWHYQASNDIKRRFKSEIFDLLDFRFDGKIKIEYFYFAPDKRTRDLMNVISVVDKFLRQTVFLVYFIHKCVSFYFATPTTFVAII